MRTLADLQQSLPSLSPDCLAAVADFVGKSSSAAGKQLKLEGMARVLQARPEAGPDFIRGLASAVDAAPDLAGRRRRMDAVTAVTAWPRVPSDDAVPKIAAFVGHSTNAEVRRRKLQALRTLARTQPVTAAAVDAIAAFVDESTTAAGRNLKCDGLVAIYQARPAAGPDFIRLVAELVNAARDLPGRTARMEAIKAVLTDLPSAGEAELTAMAGFVGSSTNPRVRREKEAAVRALADAKDLAVLPAVRAFVDESRTAAGRIVKAQTVAELVRRDPKLSADQVQEVAKLVNAGSALQERKVACQAARELFRLRADPPAPLLSAVVGFVLEAAAGPQRQQRLTRVERLLRDNPGLSGAVFVHAVDDMKKNAHNADDAAALLDVDVAEQQARALLAAEPAGPASGAGAGAGAPPMAVLQGVAKLPMVRLASRAVHLADERRAHYDALAACDRAALFSREKELHDRFESLEMEKRSPLMVAAVGGTLAAGALASMFLPLPGAAFRVGGVFATVLLGGVAAPIVARKVIYRHVPDVVEQRIRSQVAAPHQYWTDRSQALRELDARVEDAALQRVTREVSATAARPADGVRVDDDTVVIGKIRVERRTAGA